jgi:hypothetical protein
VGSRRVERESESAGRQHPARRAASALPAAANLGSDPKRRIRSDPS